MKQQFIVLCFSLVLVCSFAVEKNCSAAMEEYQLISDNLQKFDQVLDHDEYQLFKRRLDKIKKQVKPCLCEKSLDTVRQAYQKLEIEIMKRNLDVHSIYAALVPVQRYRLKDVRDYCGRSTRCSLAKDIVEVSDKYLQSVKVTQADGSITEVIASARHPFAEDLKSPLCQAHEENRPEIIHYTVENCAEAINQVNEWEIENKDRMSETNPGWKFEASKKGIEALKKQWKKCLCDDVKNTIKSAHHALDVEFRRSNADFENLKSTIKKKTEAESRVESVCKFEDFCSMIDAEAKKRVEYQKIARESVDYEQRMNFYFWYGPSFPATKKQMCNSRHREPNMWKTVQAIIRGGRLLRKMLRH